MSAIIIENRPILIGWFMPFDHVDEPMNQPSLNIDIEWVHKIFKKNIVFLFRSLENLDSCCSETELNETCPVCLESITNAKKSAVLKKCGHSYHFKCLNNWLEKSHSCPLCRNKVMLSSEDIVITNPAIAKLIAQETAKKQERAQKVKPKRSSQHRQTDNAMTSYSNMIAVHPLAVGLMCF